MSGNPDRVTAVVLAGGFGTRIKSLYPNLPKPMIPIVGRPFLEWVVRYLRRQGIRHAIISSGYLAEVVEKHFATQPVEGIHVQCVAETTPQGTGGGFLEAVAQSKETPDAWLVLNGDSLVFADLPAAAQPLAKPGVQGVVLGIEVPDTARYGKIVRDISGKLERFAEKEPGAGVVNAGVYFFRHSLLAEFPPQRPLSFEKDVFPTLVARGVPLHVSVTQAPFLDIGTPESLALAEGFIQQNASQFQTT